MKNKEEMPTDWSDWVILTDFNNMVSMLKKFKTSEAIRQHLWKTKNPILRKRVQLPENLAAVYDAMESQVEMSTKDIREGMESNGHKIENYDLSKRLKKLIGLGRIKKVAHGTYIKS